MKDGYQYIKWLLRIVPMLREHGKLWYHNGPHVTHMCLTPWGDSHINLPSYSTTIYSKQTSKRKDYSELCMKIKNISIHYEIQCEILPEVTLFFFFN